LRQSAYNAGRSTNTEHFYLRAVFVVAVRLRYALRILYKAQITQSLCDDRLAVLKASHFCWSTPILESAI
jgi:hypothetical protein